MSIIQAVDTAAEAPTTEAPAVAIEQPAAEAKLYAGKFKSVEDLEKSYTGAQSLLGRRLNELDSASQALLIDVLRPDLEGKLREELTGKLKEDAEFLTPLREAWEAERKANVPETYEVKAEFLPENWEVDANDPLVGGTMEVLKKFGLGQDVFDALVEVQGGILKKSAEEQAAAIEAEQAKIPEFAKRNKALVEGYKAITGGKVGIFETITTAEQFLELEALVAATREKPMPTPQVNPTPRASEAEIREIIGHVDYWKRPDLQEKVNAWYRAQA